MVKYLAIDLGGTEIKYGIIDETLQLVHHASLATATEQLNVQIPKQVAYIVEDCMNLGYMISGVGISTAGMVHVQTGEILFAGPTMPTYKGTNLKVFIEKRYQLPVYIHNDVNAAAIGEKWLGAAKSFQHFFCMTIGTGIGGALFVNNELFLGAHYRAAEIGHMPARLSNEKSYEQVASMKILMDQAKTRLGFTGTGKQLFEQAKLGDEAVNGLMDEWIEQIAQGIVPIIYMFDPQAIIIGGGVSKQGDYLIEKIKSRVRVMIPVSLDIPPMYAAQLGNHAALYGAIYELHNSKAKGECHDGEYRTL